eukprot:3755328-Rhodomonas_salina.4
MVVVEGPQSIIGVGQIMGVGGPCHQPPNHSQATGYAVEPPGSALLPLRKTPSWTTRWWAQAITQTLN